ncbi:MAG: extracellular solute-binding protein [Dongiaceae bacterium]
MSAGLSKRPGRAAVSRRRFLTASAATLTGLLAAPRLLRAQSTSITVLNWQGYGTDEAWALTAFQRQTGIEVIHDYYISEREMIAKLQNSPGNYDVVLTNCAWNGVAAKDGLLRPIDTAKITTFKDLSPIFRDSPLLKSDDKTYGIAWVWGMTALAYNSDVLKRKPDSIEILWNPKEAAHVAFRDDGIEAVALAAIATGQDINHPMDLAKIKAKLLALEGQLSTLWTSEDEFNKLFSARTFDVSPYWSGAVARTRTNFNLPIGYVVPKEGAIGWFDGLAIAAQAQNVDGAEKFISYMTNPDFYYTWATKVGAPASANPKANARLPANDLAREIHGDPTIMRRLQYMAPLSDEERHTYAGMWTAVKTEFAR